MGKKHKWESAWLNNATYMFFYNWLLSIAINSFKWVNLPEEIDERYLETTLNKRGFILFFKDDILSKYISLQCNISGRWDIYNIPIQRTAFASNGYHQEKTHENSVIIWNDYLHNSMLPSVQLYARKFYEIERAIDVNIKGQKFPVLITGPEQQRLVMKNLYMQYDGNEPFMLGDDTFDINNVRVLNTSSPLVAPQLFSLKQQYMSEWLTICGIENNDVMKKERLVSNEVASNYGSVEANRHIRLAARRQACKEINRMFGLNIEVYFNSDLPTMVNSAMNPTVSATPSSYPFRQFNKETDRNEVEEIE